MSIETAIITGSALIAASQIVASVLYAKLLWRVERDRQKHIDRWQEAARADRIAER